MLRPHYVHRLNYVQYMWTQLVFFSDVDRCSCNSYIEKHYLAAIVCWHFVFSGLENNYKSTIPITWSDPQPPSPTPSFKERKSCCT